MPTQGCSPSRLHHLVPPSPPSKIQHLLPISNFKSTQAQPAPLGPSPHMYVGEGGACRTQCHHSEPLLQPPSPTPPSPSILLTHIPSRAILEDAGPRRVFTVVLTTPLSVKMLSLWKRLYLTGFHPGESLPASPFHLFWGMTAPRSLFYSH